MPLPTLVSRRFFISSWIFRGALRDIQKTAAKETTSISERPFVNNVYRRSLALAPPPPVFPVYNLTRSPLSAALYYLNAWNRL